MTQAQQIVQLVRAGTKINDALAAAPIKEWGRYEDITSYWMEDGSHVWRRWSRGTEEFHAAPAGAPREANVRPYPQPFD